MNLIADSDNHRRNLVCLVCDQRFDTVDWNSFQEHLESEHEDVYTIIMLTQEYSVRYNDGTWTYSAISPSSRMETWPGNRVRKLDRERLD